MFLVDTAHELVNGGSVKASKGTAVVCSHGATTAAFTRSLL